MPGSQTAALALLTRSLREDTRLKQTYFARGGLIGFILLMLWSSQSSFVYVGAPGLAFFSKVVFTNFFFITLVGLSYFAGAVAEEKEEDTLGLLRMTNLGPLTILLGKSSSRLVGVALLLLVQLPFTLLAVTLGGVSMHQVLAAYLSLGAYIFFVCNLALLFSVLCARVSTASFATGFALLLFFAGPYWLGDLVVSVTTYYHLGGPPGPVTRVIAGGMQLFERASAYGQLESILRNGFKDRLIGFQVVSNLALGTAFFLLAWWGFDAFTRERRPGALARRMPTWRLSRFGMPGAGPRVGPGRVVEGFLPAPRGLEHRVAQGGGFRRHRVARLPEPAGRVQKHSEHEPDVRRGCAVVHDVPADRRRRSGLRREPDLPVGDPGQNAGRAGGAARFGRARGLPEGRRALLLSIVPALAFAAVGGAFTLTDGTRPTVERILDSKDFWITVLIVGTQALLLFHVAVYLSLYLKRLSLAVALAAMVMGNMLFGAIAAAIFRYGPREGTLIMYHCALLALTAFLHVRIGARLTQLAAAES